MIAAAFTVVGVVVRIEQGGRIREADLVGSFDAVTSQDAARAVGRAIGDALGDNLARRLQAGERLT